MRIVVLKGGPSSEREISLRSGAAVATALRARGHEVTEIDCVTRLLPEMPARTELVFPVLHGEWGEDGQVQALLEAAGLPYVGCGVEASRLCINKFATCELLRRHGIDTARSWRLESAAQALPPDLSFPLIIKPNAQGSTVGLSLVESAQEIPAALAKAFATDAVVMLEDFIAGVESTVGLLHGEPLPVVEIIPPGKLFDFDAKYTYAQGQTQYNCPPTKLSLQVQERMQQIARKAFTVLGCRHLTRIDMIWRPADERIVVLEANTLPGFTASSLLPKAARQVGIPFEELVDSLARRALAGD